jgi:hypothetical protein
MHREYLIIASGSGPDLAEALPDTSGPALCAVATSGSPATDLAQLAAIAASSTASARTTLVLIVVSFAGSPAAATHRSRAMPGFPGRHGKR